MDLATVAAILGHAKLNMVQRYAHPQKQHIADSMKKLALANAAAELAEFERRHPENPGTGPDSGVTISPTVLDNPSNLSDSEVEGKSEQVNQMK